MDKDQGIISGEQASTITGALVKDMGSRGRGICDVREGTQAGGGGIYLVPLCTSPDGP